jgi:hypothetical protein
VHNKARTGFIITTIAIVIANLVMGEMHYCTVLDRSNKRCQLLIYPELRALLSVRSVREDTSNRRCGIAIAIKSSSRPIFIFVNVGSTTPQVQI